MKGFGDQNKVNKKSKKHKPTEKIINQAIQLHLQGNIMEAKKYYKYCIDQDINDPRIFSNYGAIEEGLGKLEEAANWYCKAIELNPNFANAHSNLGNVMRDLGKLKEAELSTRKAIELNPNFANAHSNLGNVMRDLGKLKEAELSTRKAIELNPNFANAHSTLGNVMRDLGKLKEAELSTRKAIELNPNFANAHSNLGNIMRDLGKSKDAEISYRKAIELNPNFAEAHYNLGNIMRDLEKLQNAEISYRKAIEIKPNFAEAHSNLGSILQTLGKLKDAELSTRKAIELNPKLAKAYYNLSRLKYSNRNNDIWKNQLFSEKILNNILQVEEIDIYFARSNILHKEKKYEESSRYLELANKLKLDIKPSQPEKILNKSNILLIESNIKVINQEKPKNSHESIFIVGMFRSGSTLLESVLSMKNDLYDLGEIDILEESFVESKKSKEDINLAELYWRKVNNKTKLNITTNKNLFNYQYAGIIAKNIPNAKIIHCFRNPLDNILSIHRAHFAKGNEYSSSLVDCARIYLDQENIMKEYKNKFRSQIYDLNYDSLVSNPNKEIKSVISWLGWKWNDSYLSPHLNTRSVTTASNVQVRSPINSKSIGGWKNYKEMLQPAIEIITQIDKYRNLIL